MGKLDQVAVAGIGNTEFSKNSGRSENQLAAECIKAALDDAGLRPADVDGMVTFTIDNNEDVALVRNLGVKALSYSSRVPHGGGGFGGRARPRSWSDRRGPRGGRRRVASDERAI